MSDDMDAERVHTATILMASMLADRPRDTEPSFERIFRAAMAGACLIAGNPAEPLYHFR